MNEASIDTIPAIEIEREYKTSPARLWQAWTDMLQLRQWLGTADTTITAAENDLRVGGEYKISMTLASGEHTEVSGRYVKIEAERALSFTWGWAGTPERESIVSVHIEPSPHGARLRLTHTQLFDQQSVDGHSSGWENSVEQLAQLIEQTQT